MTSMPGGFNQRAPRFAGGHAVRFAAGIVAMAFMASACSGKSSTPTTTTAAPASTTTTIPAPQNTTVGTISVSRTAPTLATASNADLVAGAPTELVGADVAAGTNPPPAPTGKVVSVSSLVQLQTAVKTALKPGDVVELADGTYSGDGVLLGTNLVGTGDAPIVIRAKNPQGAVFTDCGVDTDGCFRVDGKYLVVQGMKFGHTGKQAVFLNGQHNRLYGNVFDGSGNGDDGSASSLIYTDGDPKWKAGVVGLDPPLVDRSNLIDDNRFLQPKNTVYFQTHGAVNNTFSHNMIEGPHGIRGGETMAIKIGYGFGAEDTNTTISYNTIRNWDGEPYVIGIKSSSTTLAHNLLDRGRIELRYGNRNTMVGNVIANGDLWAGGSDNVIAENVIHTVQARDGSGPFSAYIQGVTTNQYGTFDGTKEPVYYLPLSNSTIARNTFVSSDPTDGGSVTAIGLVTAQMDKLPSGNTFVQNVFVRNGGADRFVSVAATGSDPSTSTRLVNDNIWKNNYFTCTGACTDADVTVAPVLSTNGNAAGLPSRYIVPGY